MSSKTNPGNASSNPEQKVNEVWFDVPIEPPKNQLEFEGVPKHTPDTESEDYSYHVHIKEEVNDSEGSEDAWEDSHAEGGETDDQFSSNKPEFINTQGDDVPKVGRRIERKKSDVGECSYAEQTSEKIPASENSYITNVQLLNSFEMQLSSPNSVKQPKTRPENFACNVCRDTFASSVLLKNHKQSHKKAKKTRKVLIPGVKPFSCDDCDFKSAHVSSLKKHKMSHTGERPFKCDLCEFTCTESSNLNRHKMNHSGEKPFKCNDCEFKTINSSHLKRHIRLHTGEKPFVCDQCDYKSANSSHLKTHYMLHTGEKPFQCVQCDFKSRNSSHLKRHIKCHEKKTLQR